ncbi:MULTISPECIES: PAS domain-containing protein [Pelosinus]|uniref:histidine kinase n=1 Tax=Pelosinus fermentans B4 TaxID=1149862 RepID=I8RDY1_9FIRM|nr:MULTISPECIES: PAS domain-containing protein [Pelosinus]EIW17493.1 PAS sensor protein [Pelosinus fermentans B4]EIW23553.1 PAS/PAC sensor signal transduction histidine kinase [Pelosinus fermentans A11]OAM92048.1 PAS/PAC sensor signal transduction histidine kinase [Pelosinus fermentans DSM 17108]SDQ31924.1 two-component system, sporulation sensor kinase E [Pelosinus fermentans]
MLQQLIKKLIMTEQFKLHSQFKIITIVNKDLKCLYVSEMGAKYLGLKPIDMIGKNWRDLNSDLPSKDFERLDEKIKEVFNTGKIVFDTYISISNIEGQQHSFEYFINPIFTPSGDIEAVICDITDITESQLSEIPISNQITEISELVKLCPIAIFIVDKEGRILTVNKKCIKDFSSSQAELIGKQYRFGYSEIKNDESEIAKALIEVETSQENLSSSERKYQISKQANFEGKSQEKQQQLLNQYLTENKKLNQLIELCPLGIVLYDNKGNVIALNKAHRERISNFQKEEFLGKPGRYLLEALGLDWENSPCNQALKGIETLDYYLKNAYGNCYLLNAIPLRNYENMIIGAMTIIHDITEYEKLKEDMTKLDRLNLVGEMAAGVAHEIRNPMTVIKGYLQFLSKNVSASMVEQFCLILCELERIEQIITDFLSLARNKLVENKKQDLNAIIKGIIPLIATNAMERGIELKVNLTEGLPHFLLNEKEIKQLFLNLVRNGIEAMDHHGTLIIESILEGDMVSLSVADCGCGICKENQEKIFDPFFTTKESGTGLGLAVCAGIVRRHNGTIEVQSEEGKGTRFIITFNTLDAR